MKTLYKSILLLFLLAFSLQSCEDQDDVAPTGGLQVNDFIWKGLNQYYLYQADVPNLADDRFATQDGLNSFLGGYSKPQDLFEDLLYKPSSKFPTGQAIDRFSWIVEDYTVLEQELQGTSKNSGIDFRLSYKKGSSTDLVGFVRYVIPNSDAAAKGMKRGDVFTGVNGTQLTASNYRQLLIESDSFTLNLADINADNVVTPNNKSVSLVKTILDENPILINKVIVQDNHTIGYLMYNGFYANYDTQLNEAFAQLRDQQITDLVLDLRYNGGGSVLTATRLASMITGDFTGQIFAKQKWNDKVNAFFESEEPESLINRFTDKIGDKDVAKLRLTKVYILTSSGTASASELVINGLAPYISVVQIGDVTVGKNVGSITLYDSESFTKNQVNPNHKYAMQPLVLKIVNASGFGEYTDGLQPAYKQLEYVYTLGVLGDKEEPLLSKAISVITGKATTQKIQQDSNKALRAFIDSKAMSGIGNQMYVDKAPAGLLRALQ